MKQDRLQLMPQEYKKNVKGTMTKNMPRKVKPRGNRHISRKM